MIGRRLKLALIVAGVSLIIGVMASPALAQCAMCKTAITRAPEAKKLAESLNLAVIVLLIPPVMIFCGIFLAAFRQMRKADEAAPLSADFARKRRWPVKLALRRKRKSRKPRETGGALI